MTRLIYATMICFVFSLQLNAQKTRIPKRLPNNKVQKDSIGDLDIATSKEDSISIATSIMPRLTVKHIKGLKSIDIYYSGTKNSNGVQGGFSHFIYKDIYLQYSGKYEKGTIGYTFFEHISGSVMGNYSLYNIKNMVYFNVLVSGHIGYEMLLMTENRQPAFGMTYEGAVGTEVEIFVLPNVVLSGVFSQKVYSSSLLGSSYYEGKVGLKYIFK